jgi:spermidine/putrescine ABC transporter ATP-binding subunit
MGRDESNIKSPVLVARALRKDYNNFQAVRGVEFALRRNSYVTLLGPSGCGKTTILRMVGGFESVTAGAIELDGSSLVDVPANRRPINTVFQSYALFPHLSVADNVAFGLAVKRLPRADIERRVADALRLVRMQEMGGRRPRQLSGGQQQRVALARAIVNEPKVLLLDEPLSALDRKMRRDMQIELKDLQRRLGLTFLHVTHDQEEAFALSDWIIVMNKGRIEQQDAPEAVYRRPANAYVADFIGGANLVPGRIVERHGTEAVIETEFGGFRSPCAAGVEAGKAAFLCLRPEQLRIAQAGAGFAAAVTHTVFQGAESIVEAQVGSTKLVLHTPAPEPPSPGSSTWVEFDPQAAWITAGAQD